MYCNYCNTFFKFAYANKINDHLKKCKPCPGAIKKQFCSQTSNEDNDQSRTDVGDSDLLSSKKKKKSHVSSIDKYVDNLKPKENVSYLKVRLIIFEIFNNEKTLGRIKRIYDT